MKYLIFDTETGGTDVENSALMSFGAIVLDENLKELESYYTLVQNTYGKKVEKEAVAIHGITEEMTKRQGIPIQDLQLKWENLTKDIHGIIGHNVAFDIKIMKANFMPYTEKALDTMHVSWDYWAYQSAKLEDCYLRSNGIKLQAHNAMEDCKMVYHLIQWFVKNANMRLPLTMFPIVYDYYDRKTFGYKAMAGAGLVDLPVKK